MTDGIARAVGEEDAIRIALERFLGRGGGGQHAHAEAVLAQAAQDVGLEAVIVGDDAVLDRRQFLEVILAGEGRAPGARLPWMSVHLRLSLFFGSQS